MKSQALLLDCIAGDRKGLTLIELMVALLLTMVLVAAVYTTYQVQRTTSDVQHEVSSVQQDLRAVLDIMAWDIRQAGCDPTLQSTAGLVITQTGPTSISFSMDLNEDGDTADTDPAEQVSYTLDGTKLQRNNIAANVVTTLTSNATTLGFTYYDADNNVIMPTGTGGTSLTTAEANSVRFVDIHIQVRSDRIDPDTHDYIRRSMTKRIKMRNLGI